MSAAPGQVADPQCPRCGYDLRGIAASWRESCPLDGVCSECGLEYAWRDVLSPMASVPRWSFEHGRRISLSRAILTCGRALWPVGFWARLRLEHPVVVRRLVLLAAVFLLAAHLSLGVAAASNAYRQALSNVSPSVMRYVPGVGYRWTAVPPPTPRLVLEEFGRDFAAIVTWPYGRRTLVARSSAAPAWIWGPVQFVPIGGLWILSLAAFTLSVPPGFLALGDTFRQCRVRYVHLLRGAAYSVIVPAAVAGIGTAASYVQPGSATALAALAILWVAVYWLWFVTRYLRLTHAVWVAVAMLTIAGLVLAIVTAFAYGYGMRLVQ